MKLNGLMDGVRVRACVHGWAVGHIDWHDGLSKLCMRAAGAACRSWQGTVKYVRKSLPLGSMRCMISGQPFLSSFFGR